MASNDMQNINMDFECPWLVDPSNEPDIWQPVSFNDNIDDLSSAYQHTAGEGDHPSLSAFQDDLANGAQHYQQPCSLDQMPATAAEVILEESEMWQQFINDSNPVNTSTSNWGSAVGGQTLADWPPIANFAASVPIGATRFEPNLEDYSDHLHINSSERQQPLLSSLNDPSDCALAKRHRNTSPQLPEMRQIAATEVKPGFTVQIFDSGVLPRKRRKLTFADRANHDSVKQSGGQCLSCIRDKRNKCDPGSPCEPCRLRINREQKRPPRYQETGCIPSNIADFFLPDETVMKRFSFGRRRSRGAVYESTVDMFDGFDDPPSKEQLRSIHDLAGLVSLNYNPNNLTYLSEFIVFESSACALICTANVLCHPNNKRLDLLQGEMLDMVMIYVYHAAISLVRLLEQILRHDIKMDSEFPPATALRFTLSVCRILFMARHLVSKRYPERSYDTLSRFASFYKDYLSKRCGDNSYSRQKRLSSRLEVSKMSAHPKTFSLRLKDNRSKALQTKPHAAPRRLNFRDIIWQRDVNNRGITAARILSDWYQAASDPIVSCLHQLVGISYLAASDSAQPLPMSMQFQQGPDDGRWKLIAYSLKTPKDEPLHSISATEQAASSSVPRVFDIRSRHILQHFSEVHSPARELRDSINRFSTMMELVDGDVLTLDQMEVYLKRCRSFRHPLLRTSPDDQYNEYYPGAGFLLSRLGRKFWRGWWHETTLFDIEISLRLYDQEPSIWDDTVVPTGDLTVGGLNMDMVLDDHQLQKTAIERHLLVVVEWIHMREGIVAESWLCRAAESWKEMLPLHEVEKWTGCSTCLPYLTVNGTTSNFADPQQQCHEYGQALYYIVNLWYILHTLCDTANRKILDLEILELKLEISKLRNQETSQFMRSEPRLERLKQLVLKVLRMEKEMSQLRKKMTHSTWSGLELRLSRMEMEMSQLRKKMTHSTWSGLELRLLRIEMEMEMSQLMLSELDTRSLALKTLIPRWKWPAFQGKIGLKEDRLKRVLKALQELAKGWSGWKGLEAITQNHSTWSSLHDTMHQISTSLEAEDSETCAEVLQCLYKIRGAFVSMLGCISGSFHAH